MAITFGEKLKSLVKFFTDIKTASAILSQYHSGYLIDTGWFKSFKTKTSVDKNNNPIPWVTYPFIDFINNRLNKDLEVFEFGAGNSTYYYAERVKSVTSLEHSKDWYEKLNKNIPGNVNLIYKELDIDGEYCRTASVQGKKFDIIIDDAEDRVNCIYQSLNSLTEKGVFILDDSEREEYADGIGFLIDNKFKRLDFCGIAPGVLFKKCTTIFYKPVNCLNI